MESPAQIRRLRQLALERIARWREEIAIAEKEIALYDELLKLTTAPHRVLDLHTTEEESNLKHMQTQAGAKIGRPIISEHPFPARAVELHGSIRAAAAALGFPAATVRSWYAEGKDGRPIPAMMRDRLAKRPWSIPRDSWRSVK